ncbi:tol-pal system protein YbgF [Pseudohalioglobus lutimaris]|nr:tol-pal system protein YbgF [Pseudohalioglobus lutimaris]
MSKLLMASGLVLLTGPFCFMAQGQDYVDVEAERAARAGSSAPAAVTPQSSPGPASDPYGVQPTRSYPATSYGLNRAPAAPATTSAPAPATSGGQNVGTLFLQMQQLQQEVMRLNGMVEEQANELRKLKAQSLERYVDLDKRISGMGPGSAASVASGDNTPSVATAPAQPMASGQGASLPGESDAYRSAYSLVRGQQFGQAVDAFTQFLRNFPDGKYAPNAHYWLGELYLVIDPPDLEASRQSFSLLLSQYPDNAKAPDAMYKLGKVQYLKGNREKSREYLERVVRDYGNTNSSAVKLSRDFLEENF